MPLIEGRSRPSSMAVASRCGAGCVADSAILVTLLATGAFFLISLVPADQFPGIGATGRPSSTRMTLGPGDPPGPTVPSGRQATTVSIASWCLSNFT
jgi:hypothetical protein